jgi:hypothetical protein
MKRSLVSRALERAVLVSLSLAMPCAVAACSSSGSGSSCGVTSTQPTASSPCGQTFNFAGSAATCAGNDAGIITPSECLTFCPVGPVPTGTTKALSCSVSTTNGVSELTCQYSFCGTGRRSAGLRPARARGASSQTGRMLADAAYLEAASVDAFRVLARELEAHGAPARLRARSLRAARDEVRHARTMRALAEKEGARVAVARTPRRPLRSLEAIALENATEGCVRETFGAAVAHVQGARASDPRLRDAMQRIARDETRHAELSWEVARWLETSLSGAARDRVHAARARAVDALAAQISREPEADVMRELGLPTAAEAIAMVNELNARLWTRA